MSGLSIPALEGSDFVNRMLAVTPESWDGDSAKQQSGKVFSLFLTGGNELSFVQTILQYAFNASRLNTAKDTALDDFANDFFGGAISRTTGETDTSFRQRIQAGLTLAAITKQALSNAIEKLTGFAPQIMEPFDIGSTGAYSWNSYYGVNGNGFPARYGNAGLTYQVFVVAQLPPVISSNGGALPVYGYSAGMFYSTRQSYYLDTPTGVIVSAGEIDSLINELKPVGILVWRQYNSPSLNPLSPVTGTVVLGAHENVYAFTSLFQFANPYVVLFSPSWESSVAVTGVTSSTFNALASNAAPPGGASLDWLVAPITVGGFGLAAVAGTQASIEVPTGFIPGQIFVTPTWESRCWIKSTTSTTVTIGFSDAAPNGSLLNYGFIDNASTVVTYITTPGALSWSVPVAAPGSYQLLALPSWNTDLAVTKGVGTATIAFSTAAPTGAYIQTTVIQQ